MPRASSISSRNPSTSHARLSVIAKPGSKAPGIAVDGHAIVVRVRERAIEGGANAACIRALADCLGVASSAVTLVRGAKAKLKLFDVAGMTTEEVLERIAFAANAAR